MREGFKSLKIKSNLEVSAKIFEIRLQMEHKKEIKPGQFFMIKGWEATDPFLPRPLSVADVEDNCLTFLYEVKGQGTHLLSKLRVEDTLDVLGPLGNGFTLESGKKIALISGGIGIAPMFYLLKNLDAPVDFYAGFRSTVYWMDKIESRVNTLYVSTEDGSTGHKGFSIDQFNPHNYGLVITCGPVPMMKKVLELCEGIVPVQVSMESRMACGIGACLGCTIETANGIKRVCKEGPVFKGKEVLL
ncbi:dihydroorotate dehydrogenase electron transfer subunit [Carnobacterium iners]|uniref:Dihydroorotate dehydrogenase B (NAD(+)), electron transfer subunit n=1 Tax=Carnobacterium iners TaxID=1073423 RepID=A0A1X7MZV9_9LACT|nr:dihydroorotate dehydrogenase electron transfer subunit [Carnobacterium iners]SEK18332.1 dihydroorotate dehydrogenase electron transfer subunit [Carnobacterium iners]SMH29582.1 dihydroorotate dehydrogenase electron transfer subunit [Carnobacterium iners]